MLYLKHRIDQAICAPPTALSLIESDRLNETWRGRDNAVTRYQPVEDEGSAVEYIRRTFEQVNVRGERTAIDDVSNAQIAWLLRNHKLRAYVRELDYEAEASEGDAQITRVMSRYQ